MGERKKRGETRGTTGGKEVEGQPGERRRQARERERASDGEELRACVWVGGDAWRRRLSRGATAIVTSSTVPRIFSRRPLTARRVKFFVTRASSEIRRL